MPTDREIYFRVGLFFNSNYQYGSTPGYKGTTRHHRPATVTDGMSNTLMIAENIRTGFDPRTLDANHTTWATADARRNRVYFRHRVCRDNVCSEGNVDLRQANAGDQAINSGLTGPEGESPWPNSRHPGGVNVSMADGSTRFLSEDVDGVVYYRLFTPQGSRLNGLPLDAGMSVASGF
jgi:prepilin-type processing-associated H-X9-DG protein